MTSEQEKNLLSERLIRAINQCPTLKCRDQDVGKILDQGADVNRVHGTLLPLHCACMVCDIDMVKLLLQKGAKVNQKDGYSRAPLHYAAERDFECSSVLLQHKADPNIPDGNLDTPLHWAAFKNATDCLELLLERGAFVDSQDFNGDTPLAWAARKGHLEVIRILLDYNAEPQIQNMNGETPICRCLAVHMSGLNTDADDISLQVLLQAAGTVRIRHVERLWTRLQQETSLMDILKPYCNTPRPLMELAALCIRRSLGYRFIPDALDHLPLPRQLLGFISLE